MKNRFIIALKESTTEQEECFIQYVKEQGLNWWHWINNFWLLIDYDGRLTIDEIQKKTDEIFPGITKLILEVDLNHETWSGFGPNSEDRNMFKWLHNNW